MSVVSPARTSLEHRAVDLRELMDDPDCDPVRLAATLRRFDTVNRLVSGWGRVYRTRVAPLLRGRDRPARVLDLGCGGGDLLARLASSAARDGLEAEWLGVDPDERAIDVARTREAPGLDFRVADAETLVAAGDAFDLVVSNHVLHHLYDGARDSFAAASLALARGTVLHADIERGRTAYALYAVGITPLAPGTFLRTDGLRSIRRSYRADELAAALGPTWSVERPAPFRLLAVAQGLVGDGDA